MQSSQEKESNDVLHAFANIRSTNKDIQRMCLCGKFFILQNMPKSKTAHDSDLSIISAVKAAKNSLLLSLDLALIRANHYLEEIEKCANNSVVDSKKPREEIKQLSENCNKIGHGITIVLCSAFRDGFAPRKSLTVNEGLLSHALTI